MSPKAQKAKRFLSSSQHEFRARRSRKGQVPGIRCPRIHVLRLLVPKIQSSAASIHHYADASSIKCHSHDLALIFSGFFFFFTRLFSLLSSFCSVMVIFC
ncbi:hypothetical protein CEXT_354291 [Caerostris extrusa]|uniref:Uncharacterized protein n=1 Tax=Caerostris extrusa TaxID=172846 RepID=A0AAV4N4M9_CAEEX|nr:hypothetical protein CEXT_354291 [Caerostris extrusa]